MYILIRNLGTNYRLRSLIVLLVLLLLLCLSVLVVVLVVVLIGKNKGRKG